MKETLTLPDVVLSPSRIVQAMFEKNMDRSVDFLPYRHDLTWLKNYHGKTKSNIVHIGYLGQILKVKGIHVLVDAFVKAGIETHAHLDIWGNYANNPQYEIDLRARIGKNLSIFLRGRYLREQLGSILENLDIVVVPSIWYENAPLVIQEAFATKTPVIATNLGGMSEVVAHDINGLLFQRNDSDDLAFQLRRVVEEGDLLARLKTGIPPVRGFQDETFDELEDIYKRLSVERKLPTVLYGP